MKTMRNIEEKRQEIREFLRSLDINEDKDANSRLYESDGDGRESPKNIQERKERIGRLIEKVMVGDEGTEFRLGESGGDLKPPKRRIKSLREALDKGKTRRLQKSWEGEWSEVLAEYSENALFLDDAIGV